MRPANHRRTRATGFLLSLLLSACLCAGASPTDTTSASQSQAGSAAGAPAADAPGNSRADSPVHQLRIYEIFETNKRAFHERFRDHAMRIMARYDFHIVATWETRDGPRTQFVYLLEWPDQRTMRDRWAKFMADQEWSDIKKATRVHGALVGEIKDLPLQPTSYSPRVALTDHARQASR